MGEIAMSKMLLVGLAGIAVLTMAGDVQTTCAREPAAVFDRGVLEEKLHLLKKQAYRTGLAIHMSMLFAAIDDKYLPKEFLEEYSAEFLDGYAAVYADSPKYPTTVIVARKNKKPKTPYVYLFQVDFSRNTQARKVAPTKKYVTCIGKHPGKRRPTNGMDKKNMITPEGIFWVDWMCKNEKKAKRKPSNWKDLGPRTISMEAPGDRSPNDDIALHGSTKNIKRKRHFRRTFGCLRMYNEGVIDLYDRLTRREPEGVGAIVIVTP